LLVLLVWERGGQCGVLGRKTRQEKDSKSVRDNKADRERKKVRESVRVGERESKRWGRRRKQ